MEIPAPSVQLQAHARLLPSEDAPLFFGICTDDTDEPHYMLWQEEGAFHLQSTDYALSPSTCFDTSAIEGWLEDHFPALKEDYARWKHKIGNTLVETPPLSEPISTVSSAQRKMVVRYKNITLYIELEPDMFHFIFGANVWNSDQASPEYCEFSLRHLYIMEKAVPILYEQLEIDEDTQAKIEPKLKEMIEWLDKHHIKPPQPRINIDAGTSEIPKKIQTSFSVYKNKSGKKIKGLLSQDEYNAIQKAISSKNGPCFEFDGGSICRWDWLSDDFGRIFALYYGGKKENILGSGGFSEVRYCQEIETGDWFAVKIQSNQKMPNEKIDIEEFLLGEQDLYFSTGRIEALSLRFTFEKILNARPISKIIRPNPSHFFKNDSKSSRIIKTCQIIENLFSSAQSLHQCGHLHRDIKMENILINRKTLEVNLIDFGSSEQSDDSEKLYCICHEANPVTTNLYNAPEIVKARINDERRYIYNEATEVYALGKVIGELVSNVEGFDLMKYREDILGPEDDLDVKNTPKFFKYINYWLNKFNPHSPITLEASDFFDDKAQPVSKYSSAMMHSALRFLIEFNRQNPNKKDPQSRLWHLAARCLHEDPKKRPSINEVIIEAQNIKKSQKKSSMH